MGRARLTFWWWWGMYISNSPTTLQIVPHFSNRPPIFYSPTTFQTLQISLLEPRGVGATRYFY